MIRGSARFVSIAVLIAACGQGGAAAAAGTAACCDPTAPPATSGPRNLTVFAAASLANAIDSAAAAFTAAHPGITITISTDSSAALATQIEQGAPVDVFLSADASNPQKLVDRGVADGAAVVFARNKLTIVVPKGNPGGLMSPKDLAKSGLRIVAAGDEVPITKYATQVVANLAAAPGYPPGFAASYAANVVSKEDNVKAVIAKIELGEGDAAIVYVTDAKASDDVATIDVPDAANVAATYAGVVVRASASAGAAKAFLAWFAGPDGQAILARSGFLPPSR